MKKVNCRTGSTAGPQSLADYIDENYGCNQSAFARANGVQRAQVSQWLKAEYIVVDNTLCAVRRHLADVAS